MHHTPKTMLIALDERQRAACIRAAFLITRNNPEQVIHVREFVRGWLIVKQVLFGLPV